MEKVEEMTIAEMVATEEFRTNIKQVMDELGASRLKLADEARKRDRKLKRHPFDRLLEESDISPEAMSQMFLDVIDKKSGKPMIIRELIERIGMEAYRRTMDAEVKKNPELKKKFRKFVKH